MGPRKHRPSVFILSGPGAEREQAFWMYGRHPVLAALQRSAAFAGSGNSETATEMAAAAATAPVPGQLWRSLIAG